MESDSSVRDLLKEMELIMIKNQDRNPEKSTCDEDNSKNEQPAPTTPEAEGDTPSTTTEIETDINLEDGFYVNCSKIMKMGSGIEEAAKSIAEISKIFENPDLSLDDRAIARQEVLKFARKALETDLKQQDTFHKMCDKVRKERAEKEYIEKISQTSTLFGPLKPSNAATTVPPVRQHQNVANSQPSTYPNYGSNVNSTGPVYGGYQQPQQPQQQHQQYYQQLQQQHNQLQQIQQQQQQRQQQLLQQQQQQQMASYRPPIFLNGPGFPAAVNYNQAPFQPQGHWHH